MSGYVYGTSKRHPEPQPTVAEQQAARFRRARDARIRDVPASCVCTWKWEPVFGQWLRTRHGDGCPWCTRRAA